MALNQRFGNLLKEGLFSVAQRQGKTKGEVEAAIAETLSYSPATVDGWQRGRVPKAEHVAYLARYCVTHGRLDRAWADSFLLQAEYSDRATLLREVFPEHVARRKPTRIYQNLPPRYGDFIGRTAEMARVIEGLTSRWPLVAIEGMGGVGKTTLAVECARRCLPAPDALLDPPCDAVVWVTAKDHPEQQKWLSAVLDAVAQVLDYPYITQLAFVERVIEVDKLLRGQRVLLIVDNCETIDDADLWDWLHNLPEPSKALLTTRHRQSSRAWDIHLRGLTEPDALQLVRQHAHRLNLPELSAAAAATLTPLIHVTEGNPKALEMALGYLKYGGLTLPDVVNHLHAASQTVNDIFDYLYTHAWATLPEDARRLLLATALFADTAGRDALGATAALTGYALHTALTRLSEMALLEVSPENAHRFAIHPLTRAYAAAQLRSAPELEQEMHERQVEYFLMLTEPISHDRLDFDPRLAQTIALDIDNLLSVIENCLIHEKIPSALQIARRIEFAFHIRGEFGKVLTMIEWVLPVTTDATEKILYLNRLAWLAVCRNELEQSAKILAQAQENLNDLPADKTTVNVAKLQTGYGHIAMQEGLLQEAKTFFEKSLSLSEQVQSHRRIISSKYYLAETEFLLGNIEIAEQLLEESEQLAQKMEWVRALIYIPTRQGEFARQQGNFDLAEEKIQEGLYWAEECHEKRGIAEASLSLALLREAQGDHVAALEYVQTACDLFQRLGMKNTLAREAEATLARLQAYQP